MSNKWHKRLRLIVASLFITLGILALSLATTIGVIAQDSSCKECKTPEPDCPDRNCYACGDGCCYEDDWSFAENNSCFLSDKGPCTLSDNGKCYDSAFCKKNKFYDCDSWQGRSCERSRCSIVTHKGYDDCEDPDTEQ